MKYYKLNEKIYAFESDGSQDEYITKNMIAMTDEEVDKYCHPQNYLSSVQQYENYLQSLRPLTRRQFKLVLLDNGLLDDIDTVIESIPDMEARRYIEIEYQEAMYFERLSPSVIYMCQLLELSDEEVNRMWEFALAL